MFVLQFSFTMPPAIDVVKAIEDFKREMRAEIRTMNQSITFCSSTADDFKSALAELKTLTAEVKRTREDCAILRQENKDLTERLDKAESKILELEQYSRLNNVEIKGLPLTVKDRAAEMALRIAQTIKIPLDLADIDIAHSVKTKNSNDANLIIRFTTRTKRNHFLEAAKKANLSTSDIDFTGPKQRIYVNEHLTPHNKRLLGAAIGKKREMSWKYVWTKNGSILARKTETSDVIRINCQADLSRMT